MPDATRPHPTLLRADLVVMTRRWCCALTGDTDEPLAVALSDVDDPTAEPLLLSPAAFHHGLAAGLDEIAALIAAAQVEVREENRPS